MPEMKTLNGYEIVDAKAREDISKITVPTKTSQLTNNSGFITSSALNGYATESYVDTAVANASGTSSGGNAKIFHMNFQNAVASGKAITADMQNFLDNYTMEDSIVTIDFPQDTTGIAVAASVYESYLSYKFLREGISMSVVNSNAGAYQWAVEIYNDGYQWLYRTLDTTKADIATVDYVNGKLQVLTQTAYNNLSTKDSDTFYFIKES